MGESYKSGFVKCPFYRKDNYQDRVFCESPLDFGGRYVALSFRDRQYLLNHIDEFCCGNYQGCPVFQMIRDSKYREEHEGGYI